MAPLEAEEWYVEINFDIQFGWNRVNQILAPCVGEFCFNPLRRWSGTPPNPTGVRRIWGRQVGVKRRLPWLKMTLPSLVGDSEVLASRFSGFAKNPSKR